MQRVIRQVERYEILREIGRGGMAVVYLARHVGLGRSVALKQMAPPDGRGKSFAQRFLRESQLAGRLNHPNIVTVYDYFEHEDTAYIAMEYAAGGSLRPFVGKLTLAQIARVFEATLAALEHAADFDIVHRDLKPPNLLVADKGQIKVADFGVARITRADELLTTLTREGQPIGTPAYMSPEQMRGERVAATSDLYSLGCIAYELFTGQRPFWDAESTYALMHRTMNEQVPPARSIDPALPQPLSDWIDRLLVREPGERTQSAAIAWEQLEAIIIELLGPGWRNDALPIGPPAEVDADEPTSPLDARQVSRGATTPATPPPADLPAGPLIPGAISLPVGPPTPPPIDDTLSLPGLPAVHEAQDKDGGDTPPTRAITPATAEIVATADTGPIERGAATPLAEHAQRRVSAVADASPRRGERVVTQRPWARLGRRPRALLGGAVGAVVIVLIAVIALGGPEQPRERGTSATGSSTPVVLTSGPLTARLDSSWTRADTPPQLPGLSLRGAAASRNRAGEQAVIGMASALSEATAAFITRATQESPQARLADGAAALLRQASPTVVEYLVPTSDGVATIACTASTATCKGIVERTRVLGVTTFPLGVGRDYAASVNGQLQLADKTLATLHTRLSDADSARQQGSAAATAAKRLREAATALGREDVSPADEASKTRLAGALRASADALAGLSVAATHRKRTDYVRAARDARVAIDRIERAVRTIRGAGYSRLVDTPHLTRSIPAMKARKRARTREGTTTATASPGPQTTTPATTRPSAPVQRAPVQSAPVQTAKPRSKTKPKPVPIP